MKEIVEALIDEICRGVKHPLVRGPGQGLDILHRPFEKSVQPLIDKVIPFEHKHHSFVKHQCNETGIELLVVEPRVLQQRFNGSCGYYVLYNALTILEAASAEHENVLDRSVDFLVHGPRFWHTYVSLCHLLRKRVEADSNSSYPWSMQCIDNGVLERAFIQHIIEYSRSASPYKTSEPSDPATILSIKEDTHHLHATNLSVFSEFGLQSLKYNGFQMRNAKRLDTIICDLRSRESTFAHAFLLGVTNHWVSIVVIKTSKTTFEIFFMDSRNNRLLEVSDDDIWKLVDALMAESARQKQIQPSSNYYTWLNPEQKRLYVFESMKACQMFANLLINALLGKKDIISALLELNLDGFFEIYEREVTPLSSFDSLDKDTFFTKLLYWLENYMPPAVFETNLLRVLKELSTHISAQSRAKLLLWVQQIKSSLATSSDLKVMKRFIRAVKATNLVLMTLR
eukprot:TRINITY_DN1826_c0_g1_i1.p1 TRINITY_DN1826_c0_g1~~TRINITY_DN1826_c0_g1_i1.p1  ORF type:complete len:455 (-),score=73.25 TRINITY_DN1826_c0_g1_i1:33-1397(-)